MKATHPIVAVSLACLVGCSTQTQKAVRSDHQQQQQSLRPIADLSTQIAPGRCRIVGTLVGIDSTLEKGGPCSKAPCRGTVRVDSVLGYGAAFGNPIAVNEQINVRFAFTLAATTKDLFPTMTAQLPGLHIGAKFQTDLESQSELGDGKRPFPYLVQDYKTLK
jgi:hypothetical protein